MEPMYCIGLDVHKRTISYCFYVACRLYLLYSTYSGGGKGVPKPPCQSTGQLTSGHSSFLRPRPARVTPLFPPHRQSLSLNPIIPPLTRYPVVGRAHYC